MYRINFSFVFDLRIIGKRHSATRKLSSVINVNFPSKTAFRCRKNISCNVACKLINEAAAKFHKKKNLNEVVQCGVSVDGTWRRSGPLSLNGCVQWYLDTAEVRLLDLAMVVLINEKLAESLELKMQMSRGLLESMMWKQ
ncbi:hypothetical protein TNIN_351631 [Trichonephila inaurata madagascariensis]|uniref:Uncharacterized protein n=1 Tax=Trichonephila inaurata madagascariensis TaxID=2747483 RepID=A0A8X6K0F1_9ARAC|nr:hypothetical protein TNIN_351631 [Trichonephila inaurata madagascariensis]